MCEEASPVKALNFLQTEVSSVVDHNDPQETEIFRSLLSHLLAPPPATDPSEALRSDVHFPTPPRKRTRPNTPDESWTNRLDEDEVMGDPATSVSADAIAPKTRNPVRVISSQALRGMEDAEERMSRNDGGRPLPALRYEQRTRIFECLLEFVGEDSKQPSGNLVNMVDRQEAI
jgi:hypothetical protein